MSNSVQAWQEITGGAFPAHTYLLDGATLWAYQRVGHDQVKWFSKPIRGFDRRGRKFKLTSTAAFEPMPELDPVVTTSTATTLAAHTHEHTAQGSQGRTYTVNTRLKTCTCPGAQYRGICKHLAAHGV